MLKEIAIIGAQGRMGVMLKERLQAVGRSVRGADQPLTPEVLAAACAGVDAVVLCVPAAAMMSVCALLAPCLGAGTILMDIASVKVLPMIAMEKYYAGPVVGTHPLFGPHPKPEDRAVCVTPGKGADEAAVANVEELFRAMGCSSFRSTAEIHDRAMASIQGLNFITSVAYFAMLSNQRDLAPYLTPSLHRRMEAARTMLTADAELFTGIVSTNPLSQEVVREFRSYLNVAAGGDIDVLVELARRWFEAPPV